MMNTLMILVIFCLFVCSISKELTGNLTLIRPEKTRFIAGQSIDITCKTEVTYTTTNITWYIDTADNKLYEDITTDIEDGVSTSRLRLTLDKHLNNHTLYCSAFNGYGEVQTDFLKLDVTCLPTIHIVIEATSIAIVEGEQLLLTCSVQDTNPRVPPHGYTWSRNGIKLIDQTSNIFKVNSTSSRDTGDYTCTGNNGIGIGISSPVKVNLILCVYEVVIGLSVCLALFMVLSIVLSFVVAYLMLKIRRLTTSSKEGSNYDGLEQGNREDDQYSSTTALVPDTSPEQIPEYYNQTSNIAGATGDNSLYENV
ncbi:B-cell receptor CD22-like [Patella vulgata]|uniref:B-cell receptor CD22-like n=1 Tax=Patella vulgata TaxID=6465 RepID=UPI0024A84520|nr:B-cell receptor CD22-like [Patella vulgata]